MITIKEIRTEISLNIEDIILPLGFKIEKKGSDCWIYSKLTDFGFNKIYLCYNKYPPIYIASITKMVRISAIEDILNKFSGINPDYADQTTTIGAKLTDYGYSDDGIKIENKEELGYAVTILKNFTLTDSKSFFDCFNSINSIDLELNKANRQKDLYTVDQPFVGLIAAKLNCNKDYSYWENYYSDYLSKKNEYIKNQFEKLKDYLKKYERPTMHWQKTGQD